MGELKTRDAPFPVAQISTYSTARYSDLFLTLFWKLEAVTLNQASRADSNEWRSPSSFILQCLNRAAVQIC